ncbi:carbohydrate-binding protein [Streptomyces sp. SAJ15]|uniref:carbohydrate-binding protein n=1 Tax=Streptomyces sp. SAJ15 TaxID=2011095 RepID=UPI00118563AE|nr:carbohydrate-binding protein [Streptomyces sp. SAJ15]TVL88983.1 carbohydrate-binding protein [Streptomyces sp. SAJ15]
MTAGNNGNGADTPENDDPFAYLYRQDDDGTGQGGQPQRTGGYGYPGPGTPPQPGVPRTSYNHVRAVGERTYGGQQSYAQQPPTYGQQGYGQQGYGAQRNAHYAAPETLPGGAPRQPAPPGGGRGSGGGRGPNIKGLLIGAIAVVAVVVTGIGVAIVTNGDDKKKEQANEETTEPTGAASVQPKEPSEKPSQKPAPLPTDDASGLTLAGGAAVASEIKGAQAKGGTYVGGFNKVGASATWSLDVPDSGKYTLFVGYGVPGKDASSTLTINGQARTQSLNLKNWAKAGEGQWDKGWTHSYAWLELNKGTNTIKISCEQGDKCEFNLDQVWMKTGHVTK